MAAASLMTSDNDRMNRVATALSQGAKCRRQYQRMVGQMDDDRIRTLASGYGQTNFER